MSLSRSTYTLDPVGNRLSIQTTSGTETYTYDVLDRLTQACYTVACTGPGDNFRRYTYDPLGNRLTEVRDTGTTTATYDAADQLSGTTGPAGAVSYSYDLDGRQTAAGSRTFAWAQPDRLASTTQANTTTTYGCGATRVVAGALAGCAFTFASQVVGGRAADYLETGIGCATGGVGSYPQLRKVAAASSLVRSLLAPNPSPRT